MTTTTLLLMYEIAQNNKIRNSRRYDTSNHFTSEYTAYGGQLL
jgi:hypothetical protein